MATFVQFDEFGKDLMNGVHNLSSNTLKWMLTNTAPVKATSAVKADITEISAGNGYTAGGIALTGVTVAEVSAGSGQWRLSAADTVITATGAIGPFRYAVLYNDTPTSPADPLIGYIDRGSALTMANSDTYTIDILAGGITVLTV